MRGFVPGTPRLSSWGKAKRDGQDEPAMTKIVKWSL
jgi:hypothetical protein